MIFWKDDPVSVLTKPPYLVFDIGGTKMRLAMSIDGKNLGSPLIIDTPKSFNQGMQVFAAEVKKLIGQNTINFAAGGIAGSLDSSRSTVFNAPHLPDWSGKNLKKSISEILHAPVLLENDTAMVGLGEAVYGGGKGFRIVVYITLSTGVNGVRVIEGKIDRSAFGFEIGHQIINFDASATEGDWGRGELEDYISGAALETRYKKSPVDLTDEKIWDQATRNLSVGLHNTIVHWSPEVIVIGGSVSKKINLEKLQSYIDEVLNIFPSVPVIKPATLGELGGLYGSLFFIQNFGVV